MKVMVIVFVAVYMLLASGWDNKLFEVKFNKEMKGLSLYK